MTITSTPARFSPAFEDALYAVRLESASETATVEVYDSTGSTRLGTKRLSGAATHPVNVSAYVRGQFLSIAPLPVQSAGVVSAPQRVVNSHIRIGATAASAPHTAGCAQPAGTISGKLLSENSANRELGPDEQDELFCIAPAGTLSAAAVFSGTTGERVSVSIGTLSLSAEGPVAVVVNAASLDEKLQRQGWRFSEFSGFTVGLASGDTTCFEASYAIRPACCDGVRLHWLNRWGGIDGHTFQQVIRQSLASEKERLEVGSGDRITRNRASEHFSAVSEPRVRSFNRWLSAVAASPRVWMVREGAYVPVEITSDEMEIHNDRLGALKIGFRTAKANYQNL